ncbi:MAG TPA: extracellular solute-binding protein [Verrucomicrobiae bacterium]|jgi:iron(III) transport system substrate-binding protein|nr:extracellular solute-binding protein [Verrucomicrobiae bacterium]
MSKFLRLVAFAAGAFFVSHPANAQSLDAAKKEGKAVVYGSLESDTMEAITKAFTKKTGIEVDYWRASATKVMDRAQSEFRSGKPLFDAIATNDNPLQLMQKEGMFAKYDSPSAKAFPKDAIDPNLGPRYRNVIIGIVYNKGIIKPADAPKSLEDLLKPQYRGKIVMPDPTQHTTTTQWVASLDKVMGSKEKADKFIKDLAAMKPVLVESLLPAAERVATGETPIAITYVKYTYIFGQKGAPLDYVRLPRMMGDGHYIPLAAKPPHPNAGKAFIDFFLGDEGMNIMAKMGEFVNRKGVLPPLPDADKIQFVNMIDLDTKGFAEKKKEYTKTFLGS